MYRLRLATLACVMMTIAITVGVSGTAKGQGRPDPAVAIAAQRAAMIPLANLDGVWRGIGWTVLPSGEKHTLTQTERVGSFLDGSVKVVEGKGYDADGSARFNAFGVISYNPATKTYNLRSYAEGNFGDFNLKLTTDGFIWEIPAGPMTIRFTTVIKDGTWREVGDRIMPGKEPVRFLEMNLKRIGDSTWPAAGAVPPK